MLIADIDHVQLAAPAGCEEQARDFFGRILGLEELVKPEPVRARGGCWFQVGSRQLHIGLESDFRPARKAHPAFAVADATIVYTTLQAEGVQCTWDHDIEGIRRFFANDPWGNRLEFTESSS